MGGRTRALVSLLAVAAASLAAPANAARPRWETLTPAPTPRTEAAAVALGHDIYLVGGFVPGGATVPLVEIYDTKTDTWRVGPSLPVPVNHAYAAAVGDSVYVFGGYLGPAYGGALQPASLPTDLAFKLTDGVWEPIERLPSPRGAGSAAVVGSKVYLVGGVDEDSLAQETLVYDTRAGEWSTGPGLPIARQHLGVASSGSRVFAVGGRYDLLDSNMSIAHSLAAGGARWRDVAPLRVARGGLGAAATSNGLVVAVGGEFNGGVFSVAEALSTRTGRWTSLPPLPTPRHGLGVVAVGTKVYALAGGIEAGYSYSTSNEAIDLASL